MATQAPRKRRLSVSDKYKVFIALVKLQDSGMTPYESEEKIKKQFNISDSLLDDAVLYGITRDWLEKVPVAEKTWERNR